MFGHVLADRDAKKSSTIGPSAEMSDDFVSGKLSFSIEQRFKRHVVVW